MSFGHYKNKTLEFVVFTTKRQVKSLTRSQSLPVGIFIANLFQSPLFKFAIKIPTGRDWERVRSNPTFIV